MLANEHGTWRFYHALASQRRFILYIWYIRNVRWWKKSWRIFNYWFCCRKGPLHWFQFITADHHAWANTVWWHLPHGLHRSSTRYQHYLLRWEMRICNATQCFWQGCLEMIILSEGASLVLSHITHSLTLRMDSNYVLYIIGSLIVALIDLKVCFEVPYWWK